MDNKQLIKGALIFGGGFLLFAALRPKPKKDSSLTKKLEGDSLVQHQALKMLK